jgi:cysteine desulfurase / selenocysteine lyase
MTSIASIAAPSQAGFDVRRIREDFPILRQTVHGKPLAYLDNAATTQKPRAVLDALMAYYSEDNANVHRGVHLLSERATRAFEDARVTVQRFINAASVHEIVFTRNATEGINLVAQTFGRTRLGPGDEVLISTMEHHSNIVPWQMVCEEKGASLRVIPITDEGALQLEEYERLLGPRTKLVSIVHLSNVLGTVNPVQQMIATAHRHGVPVLIDGSQAVHHMTVDVQALDADFYVFTGHKLYGPTGIGVLYGRRELLDRLEPGRGGSEMIKEVWIDRAQWNDLPWRFEPGTPPIAEAVGLTAAIEYLEKLGMDRVAEHEARLAARALQGLGAIPGVRVYGPPPDQPRGAVVAFAVDGLHPHDVAALLDADGIAVRAGHHCAMPLMRRLGVVGTSRASFAVYTSPDDVDTLIAAVAGLRTKL